MIFSKVLTKSNFLIIFMIFFIGIIAEVIIIIIVSLLNRKIDLRIIYYLINFINEIIFYYLIGPIIFITLSIIFCENNFKSYLNVSCFSNLNHILFIILSIIMLSLYIIIMLIYSIYCTKINLIKKTNLYDNKIRVNCNYELYCLISKIVIFIFYFISYMKNDNNVYKYIFILFNFINCLKNIFFKNIFFIFINKLLKIIQSI